MTVMQACRIMMTMTTGFIMDCTTVLMMMEVNERKNGSITELKKEEE